MTGPISEATLAKAVTQGLLTPDQVTALHALQAGHRDALARPDAG